MSTEIKNILTDIEQLERNFDEYIQAFHKNSESVLQNLKNTWKMIKLEDDEVKKHEETINNQNSEITKLKITVEDLMKKVDNLKTINEELISKNTELNSNIERLNNEITAPSMELEEILSSAGTKAGEYKLFDPVAIRVVARSKISTVIFNGVDPNNLARVFHGEKIGTRIVHDGKR